MARRHSQRTENFVAANKYLPPSREINILLLGPTGVGKTTFINALANYLVYDTLEDAVNDKMQVIIPATFNFTNPEDFEEVTITLGEPTDQEKFSKEGHSNTQSCRSFVFPAGTRSLRLIDTPGIGDTRGPEQDSKNFQEILNFIAQYEHLNGVFILLKPNEERLTILFRFAVNELLRHLHKSVNENLMFVFTNARSTFFMPGSSKKLLEGLLETHRQNHDVTVPLSKNNTFLFDSEPFRYLAIRKHGIQLDADQTLSYTKSWEHSVKEYSRLMAHIVTCPLHAVSNTLSLNEAEQLIRKLPRPIAETAKLIEENLQLAQNYKKEVLKNPDLEYQGIPQVKAVVKTLKYPRTVCVGENCCRTIEVDGEVKMEYIHICHDECYLNGVQQETLSDEKLEDCTAMDPDDGFCTVCGCHWLQHKHITYEYLTNRTHINSTDRKSSKKDEKISLKDIDKRITDLRGEMQQIQNVYKKLAAFLYDNSLLPVNDDYVEYLQYFIREERMKSDAGASNANVIAGLEKLAKDHAENIENLKKTLKEQKESARPTKTIEPEEVFTLVESLYQLPINGNDIYQQVNGIKIVQEKNTAEHEYYIKLPPNATDSKVMKKLEQIVS